MSLLIYSNIVNLVGQVSMPIEEKNGIVAAAMVHFSLVTDE